MSTFKSASQRRFALHTLCILLFALLFSIPGTNVRAALPRAMSPALLNDGTYTLSLTTSGSGSVSNTPSGNTFSYGQNVQLNALPAAGWIFDSWSGDLVNTPANWHGAQPYRFLLTVKANGVQRQDKPVEVDLNFTSLLANVNASGAFNPASIRVVEVATNQTAINSNVIYQFDQDSAYNAASNATGTLIFMLDGSTQANQERTFQIYFDQVGTSYTSPTFTPQVVTSTANDEGQSSFKFQTLNSTWFYQKTAGGFSSLNDKNGNDWISYSTAPAETGVFRGIPNMIHPGGGFHPGATNSQTTLVSSGPLKATILTETTDGLWKAEWAVYSTYATMTVLKAPANYWFLYEGTPGGVLDVNDSLTLSTGSSYAYDAQIDQDLSGEEWLYISDPNVGSSGRSIFLVHHEEDTGRDSYRLMGTTTNGINSGMTVFGFGRALQGTTNKYLTGVPHHFTVGLIDKVNFADAKTLIRSSYKEMNIVTGTAEANGTVQNITAPQNPTATVTMVANRAIVANFKQIVYTVQSTTSGSGTVTITPPTAVGGYHYGDQITLTATAAAGWAFDHWSGDLTSTELTMTDPTLQTTIQGNIVVEAFFVPVGYTLQTFQVGQGQFQKNPDKPTYSYDESVTLSAQAAPGWAFTQWNGSATSTSPNVTLSMTSNQVMTATFTALEYQILSTQSGSGTVTLSPAQSSYHYGDSVTISATPAPGWSFTGWGGGLSGSQPSQSITVTGSLSVKATFTANRYLLTTETIGNGTITLSPVANDYLLGASVGVHAQAAPGWTFAGWSGDLSGTELSKVLTIDVDPTITATFVENRSTVHAQIIGNGTIIWSPQQDDYAVGESVTLTAEAAPGWAFARWGGDVTGNQPTTALTIDLDPTVTAIFVPLSYTAEAAVMGDGTVAISPVQDAYEYGDLVTFSAEAAPGWAFAGWQGALAGVESTASLTVTQNLSVTATFIQDRYLIDVQALGSGTITIVPSSTDYSYGDVVTLSAQASPGWSFAGWSSVLTGNEPTKSLTMVGNLKGTAQFVQNEYQLLTEIAGSGTIVISPTLASYRYGDSVTVTAVAAGGWTFSGWAGALAGNGVTHQVTVLADVAIGATFTQNQVTAEEFTLSVDTVGNGQVGRLPDKESYVVGEQVTLTATPDVGWRFVGWSGVVTGSSTEQSITVEATAAVEARFEPIIYQIQPLVVGEGTVMIAGQPAELHYNDIVTVTAQPASGWRFAQWSGALSGTDPEAQMRIQSNSVVTAIFVLEDDQGGEKFNFLYLPLVSN